jgi:ribonuclease HI
VLNPELWAELLRLCSEHEVMFEWVKGHAGNFENERCDQFAHQAAQQGDLLNDEGYEAALATSANSGLQQELPNMTP